MITTEAVLLVLFYEMQFWVSGFLYSFSIYYLSFLQGVWLCWGEKVKKTYVIISNSVAF